MPKYEIQCDVESASGWQIFTVEADSEQEAVEKFKNSGGEFSYQEVEVQELGAPHCLGLAAESSEPVPSDLSFSPDEIETLMSALNLACDETTPDEQEAKYNALIRKLEQSR